MLLTVQNEEEKRYFEVVFSGGTFSVGYTFDSNTYVYALPDGHALPRMPDSLRQRAMWVYGASHLPTLVSILSPNLNISAPAHSMTFVVGDALPPADYYDFQGSATYRQQALYAQQAPWQQATQNAYNSAATQAPPAVHQTPPIPAAPWNDTALMRQWRLDVASYVASDRPAKREPHRATIEPLPLP